MLGYCFSIWLISRPALVQIMACRLFVAKPLSKPMLLFVNWTLRNNLSEILIKILSFHSGKCISKYRLRNGGPFFFEGDGLNTRGYFTGYMMVPVPLTVFRSNSKFDQNLECCRLKYTEPTTTKFYTVVTCANISLWSIEHVLKYNAPNFDWTRIRSKYKITLMCVMSKCYMLTEVGLILPSRFLLIRRSNIKEKHARGWFTFKWIT